MGYLKFDKTDGVARVTLDRPKHNWLNIDLMNELNARLDELLQDDELKCLVILGEGRSWSAGVDVGDHTPAKVDQMISTFNGIFERLELLEVPIIAAVHGRALGGGMELAIAADIIVAARSALFGQPEVKLAFFPPYAAMRLPQLVGPAKAIEICCTGATFTAERCQTMGMISRVVDDDAFTDEVERVIKEIRHASPLILRLNKRAVKASVGRDFATALAGVSELFLGTLMKTEDTLEGIASFEERRRPVWKNR
jgi:cyclohexa-1,5-dienecarbonyl-CoA hydratase